MQFVDLLRKPDFVYGATEASDLRFEEKDNGVDCPVQYEYKVEKDSAKIIVYPSGNPVKYLKFRFCEICLLWTRCTAINMKGKALRRIWNGVR